MFEQLGFENLTAPQAAVWLGLLLGVLFGAAAQVTRFCLRRAIAGDAAERAPALTIWISALAAGLIGTQIAVSMDLVTFADHRFLVTDMPVAAIVIGGLMFGAGMVLTRGCISRFTVLTASGNLRGLTVLAIFAITAHATLKGILAPLRTSLGAATVSVQPSLPGAPLIWAIAIAAIALGLIWMTRPRALHLALALLIGLLVPAGWVGTGFILFDDFDPVALQSLSFTAPFADTLFWAVASTSIPANFGVGLIGGTLIGALISALSRHEFKWQSFETPAQTGRYAFGAGLMGIGGVLAGGCTVGAGLAGVPTLSLAAVLALGAIVTGAALTNRALQPRQPHAVPAE